MLFRKIESYIESHLKSKSGRDYTIHSALTRMVTNEDYHVQQGLVLSNERTIRNEGKIRYMPIYSVMFIDASGNDNQDVLF